MGSVFKEEVLKLAKELPFAVRVDFTYDRAMQVVGNDPEEKQVNECYPIIGVHITYYDVEHKYTTSCAIAGPNVPPAGYIVRKAAYEIVDRLLENAE